MSRRALAWLVVAHVLTRGLLVLSCADVFFHGDELVRGSVAKALLDHLPIAWHELPFEHYEGGAFYVAHFAALSFLVVGESLLALKLVALLASTLLLVVGARFTARLFGARAGVLFGLFFVLAPDVWLRCSTLALGTHLDAQLFVALILLGAFEIARAPDASTVRWFSTGLAAGFGISFSLQCAAAALYAAVWLAAHRRVRASARGPLLGLTGFALGLSPFLARAAYVGAPAWTVRGESAFGTGGLGPKGAFLDLFGSLAARGDAFDYATLAAFAALVACAWILGRIGGTRATAGFVLGYIALYAAIFLSSPLTVPTYDTGGSLYRASSLWFFGAALAAAGASHVCARWRLVGLALVALPLVSGTRDLVRLVRAAHPERPLANARLLGATKGHDYALYLDKLAQRLPGSAEERIDTLLHYRDASALLPASIADAIFATSDRPLGEVLAILERGFGARASDSLPGLGRYLLHVAGDDVADALARAADAPEPARAALVEAVARASFGARARPERIAEQVAFPVDPRWRDAWLRGAGWRVRRAFALDPVGARAFVERQPADARAAVRAGWERAVAEHTLPGRAIESAARAR